MLENPAVSLSALRYSCAKIACCSSELIFTSVMRAAALKMRASNSSHVSTFILLTSVFTQPHKLKSSGVKPGD